MALSAAELFRMATGWVPVLTVGSNTPAVGPATGDRHVVGTAGTGAWNINKAIACYNGSAWVLTAPAAGMRVFNADDRTVYGYDGSAWTAALVIAPLASPAFTSTPTAPTAAPGTNTTQLATTAFVQTAMAGKAFALRRTILFSDADVDVAAASVNLQFPAVAADAVLIGIATNILTAFDDGEGSGDPYTLSIDLPDGSTFSRNLTTPTGPLSTPYAHPYAGNIGGGLTEIHISADSGNVGDLATGSVTLTMYFVVPTITTVPAGSAP